MFLKYFQLECKRILRLFLRICVVTAIVILIAACVGVAGASDKKNNPEENSVMNIGIVTDGEDGQLIEMGIYFLEHTDEIKNMCKFEYVTEKEGQKMLDNGQIDALAIFPENYVRGVYYGTEEPITLRFGTAQSGLSSLLFKQLTDAVSNYMMEAKAGIYAMQDMYDRWELNYSSDADKLTERYIMKIIDRKNMIICENVSATGDTNVFLYYFTVALVLLLMFWGLNCGSVLGKNEGMLGVLIKQRGVSVSKQYLCKLAALFILFSLSFAVVAVILKAGVMMLNNGGNQYSEEASSLEEFISIINNSGFVVYIKILPGLLLVCSFVMFVYEVFHDGVGGMMFIFFSTVIMAFLSGFFYPASLFPVWVQNIGKWLPTGILFEYITGCVEGNYSFAALLKIIGFSLMFFAIYQLRNKREVLG